MTQLYIGGKEVDLSSDISISWTYEDSELDTPTAEKNSFSKSVDIEGTPNNNNIFGDYWRLDRNILDNGSTIGVDFDARHRVDFKLIHNSDIIESGYVKLDEIKIEDGKVTYSVTLYGGLGDFFYGLMYDEEGEEKNLADLHYGFSDTTDEDKHLCNWDASFITESWNKLKKRSSGAYDENLSFNESNETTDTPSYIEVVKRGTSQTDIWGTSGLSLVGAHQINVAYFKSVSVNSSTPANNYLFGNTGSTVGAYHISGTFGMSWNNTSLYTRTTDELEGSLTMSSTGATLNGTVVSTDSKGVITNSSPLLLFNGAVGERIGRITIIKSNKVYADFIPVRREGKVGFYEVIRDTYYYPKSGTFKYVAGTDSEILEDMSVSNWITACPTYSGTYDDFDNSKVLVNYDSMSGTTGTTSEVLPQFEGCAPKKGWFIAEATRDLDEWETRDLRSIYQRPAIKNSLIMKAISNPDNNGGYEIEWDDEILNSPYFKDSWVMMDRFDFDNDETANSTKDLYMPDEAEFRAYSESSGMTSYTLKDIDGNTSFNLSGYTNPNLEIDFNVAIRNTNSAQSIMADKTYYSTYFTRQQVTGPQEKIYYQFTLNLGGLFLRFEVYDGDTLYSQTPNYFIKTPINVEMGGWESSLPDWKSQFATKLGITEESIVTLERSFTGNSTSTRLIFDEDINISMALPKSDNITIKVVGGWNWIHSRADGNSGLARRGDTISEFDLVQTDTITPLSFVYDEESGEMSGIYDGTINPSVQKTNITKNILFGTSSTPYDYLIGFTKMIGAKCETDVAEKKVYIKLRKNFYKNEVKNITDKIDRSQEITINPTLTEYKWYLYGFETPESYAAKIYNSKNKTEYGKFKFDTGYYFNNETNDLYEDIVFTSAIPYKHSSMYFNTIADSTLASNPYVPSIFLSPTFEWTAWDESGETQNGTLYGLGKWDSISNIKDSTDKLCCFDDSDGDVSDITNCFVFFNGFQTCATHTLSDNLKIMSQLNENPCFIAINGTTAYDELDATDETEVCKNLTEYPRFSKYLTDGTKYTYSLDFKKPSSTFIGNSSLYQDGIAIYDRFWKGYIEDLYDANSKSVTVRYFLEDTPREAMKKFYYIDNGLWRLNTITDYDCDSSEPTECTFVKVLSIGNYLE